MIARHWRGWTRRENADGYENFLKERLLPELKAIEGYNGAYVLRKDGADETEFLVVNLFESLEAVIRFAGPEYTVAIFEPEAEAFLSRIENFATHYDVRVCTVPGVAAASIG
jgi:heme-degrading monooxygenase HmoA